MKLKKSFLALLLASISSQSIAAGYALMEQSVTGLGRAFSGSAAVADDASTIFFNPAGLTQIKRSQWVAGLHYIAPKAEFENNNSSLPSALGGGHLNGSNGGDGGRNAFLPNIYYAHRFNDNVVGGIGINTPFGMVTDYSNNWAGRYHALESNLRTININPSLAFKANDKLSLGGGINIQYIDLRLSQAVDFGAVCAAAGVASCARPQAHDGRAMLNADDWSWGYNLGLTYQFNDATRLGISYRSKISHHLNGKGKFRLPENASVGAVANTLGFEHGNVNGRVSLPEIASVALHHQLTPEWAVMGDVSWTRWSRFESLVIDSNITRLNSSKAEDWNNSMRYGLGVEYTPTGKWSYRGGIAYDETPVPNQHRRTPRIPDNNRTWVALGVSYAATENLTFDAAYAHMFIKDAKINDVDASGYALKGTYESSVDIISVQARWEFD